MPGRRPSRSVDRRDFKIGIMCALVIEAEFIIGVFDERWDIDHDPPRGDHNTYTTGMIAGQNVVLVYSPGEGSINAARSATSMTTSFPEIEFIMVVGICGAVPSYQNKQLHKPEKIWLGDCLISTAVVKFDHGREEAHGFQVKGDLEGLGRSKPLVTGIMAKYQTSRYRKDLTDDLKHYLQELQEEVEDPASISYPVNQFDQQHCEQPCTDPDCESRGHQPRTRPQNDKAPSIHFGYFGCSDKVVKSAKYRDSIAQTHKGIIAFEMESAGTWEVCPTIVIKAVCDYADNHKDKVWQRYAAAVAAAGLKAFLSQTRLADKFQSARRSETDGIPISPIQTVSRESIEEIAPISRVQSSARESITESISSLQLQPPIRRTVRKSVPSRQFQNFDIASQGHITAVVSPDFRWLAYGPETSANKSDASIIVHNLQNGSHKHTIPVKDQTQVRSLVFDHKGKILASSHGGYWYKSKAKGKQWLPVRIILWSVETGRQMWICKPHTKNTLALLPPVITMSFSSDDSQLAVVYSSKDLPNSGRPPFFIINVSSGEISIPPNIIPSNSRLGHFSPDDSQYFVYLESEIAVFKVRDHQRGYASIPASDKDMATFMMDGRLLITYHDGIVETYSTNGVVDTQTENGVTKKQLDVSSDISFDEDTRIIGRLTAAGNELIIVMANSHSQQLCLASPESKRCRIISSHSHFAKVLDISSDGQYLAWCEMKTPGSACQIRVCNIQKELQAGEMSCSMDDID